MNFYKCPKCRYIWSENYSVQVMSECPACELRGILPKSDRFSLDQEEE